MTTMLLDTTITSLARELFRVMQANGQGGLDLIGIVKLFETMAGLNPKQ